MPPSVGDTLPDTSDEGNNAGDEDGTTASKISIQRIGEPTSDYGTAELGDIEVR